MHTTNFIRLDFQTQTFRVFTEPLPASGHHIPVRLSETRTGWIPLNPETRLPQDLNRSQNISLEQKPEWVTHCASHLLNQHYQQLGLDKDFQVKVFSTRSEIESRSKLLWFATLVYQGDKNLEGDAEWTAFNLWKNRVLGESFSNRAGIQFKLSENNLGEKCEFLSRPDLHFNAMGTARDKFSGRGMDSYGPFQAPTLKEPHRLNLLVLCPPHREGAVEQWLGQWKDGLKLAGGLKNDWSKPFIQTFFPAQTRISIRHEVSLLRGESVDQMISNLRKTLNHLKGQGKQFDLAVYLPPKYPSPQNIDLLIQCQLLHFQIPNQSLKNELAWEGMSRATKIRDLSLRMFAKMGGVPWRVNPQQTISHEMIIGVGMERNPQTGAISFGYNTIFTAHGEYLLGKVKKQFSPTHELEDFFGFINENIGSASQKGGWEPGSTLRLIFHLDEKLKDPEVAQLNQMVHEYFGTKFNIRCAWLKISQHHPLRMWDRSFHGSGGTKGKSGIYQAKPSTFLQFSGERALIQVAPRGHFPEFCPPLHIQLLPGSEFADIRYLAKQVNQFCALSWSAFTPSRLPVTLSYSRKIARFFLALQSLPKIPDLDFQLNQMEDKPWYL